MILNVLMPIVSLWLRRPTDNWMLYPAVPPAAPICRIPSSVTTGRSAFLSCFDDTGSPPPTYRWYKDGTLLPPEPSKISGFKNATYKLNPENGNLVSYMLWPCTMFVAVVPHGLRNDNNLLLLSSGVSSCCQDGRRSILLSGCQRSWSSPEL